MDGDWAACPRGQRVRRLKALETAQRPASLAECCSWLFDRHFVVPPFPARAAFPVERENDLAPSGESVCRQVHVLHIASAIDGIAILMALPAIEAPVHERGFNH